MAGIYKSRFSGAEIDRAIDNAINFDPGQNGWERLASTVKYPINVTDLVNPGNYVMDYFINGPAALEGVSPINVSVIKKKDQITQYIHSFDNIYYRDFDMDTNTYPDEWNTKKTSNYMYIDEVPEEPEPNSLAILRDEEGRYTLNIYDKSKGKYLQVATPDVMLGKIYDSENRGIDFFIYADDMYNEITGAGLGLQWTPINTSEMINSPVSCLRFISDRPEEYILTFQNSSKVLYHLNGEDLERTIGNDMVNPQIVAYTNDMNELDYVMIYDNGNSASSIVYVGYGVDALATFTAVDISTLDMSFDALNIKLQMDNPVLYGRQSRSIQSGTPEEYLMVEFSYQGIKYFAKMTINITSDENERFSLTEYTGTDTWLTAEGYGSFKNTFISKNGRLCTSSDYMNPDSSECELIYLTYVEDNTEDAIFGISNDVSFGCALQYTKRETGSWYLRPVVVAQLKDSWGDINVAATVEIFDESEYFIAVSNFMSLMGSTMAYGVTNTGSIYTIELLPDMDSGSLFINVHEIGVISTDYISTGIIYSVDFINIFRHKESYPLVTQIIQSTVSDNIIDIAKAHFTNVGIHFNERDRAALMLRETTQNVKSKLYNLQKSDEAYVNRQILETEKRLEDVETDIKYYSIKLLNHIEDQSIHSTAEKQEYWNSKAEPDHEHMSDGRVEIDASKIISGVIHMDRLPKGAKERITKVATYADMLNLTIEQVQDGDRVAVRHAEASESTPETWELYEVVNETLLATVDEQGVITPGSPDAFLAGSAGSGTYVDWENVENKPNTIGGFGITNAYTKKETEELIDSKIGEQSDILNTRYYEYNLKEMYDTIHETENTVDKINSEIEDAINVSMAVQAQKVEYEDLLERVNAMSEDMSEMDQIVDDLLAIYS